MTLPPTPARFAAKRFGRARYVLTVHWYEWGRVARYYLPEVVGMAIIVGLAAIGLAISGGLP